MKHQNYILKVSVNIGNLSELGPRITWMDIQKSRMVNAKICHLSGTGN